MTRFTLLAGVAVSALTISNVYAQTTTWTAGAGSSAWNNASNWNNGVPQTGYIVIIKDEAHQPLFQGTGSNYANSFAQLHLDESGADMEMLGSSTFLIITGDTDADLTVNAGARLEIDDAQLRFNASGGVAVVNGDIDLVNGSSEIRIDQSTDFTGTGQVVLNNANAEIFIFATKVLENQIEITGQGAIVGELDLDTFDNGIFNNIGTVKAVGGTLLLHANTVLQDSENSQWEIMSGGTMDFNRTTENLEGDFVLNGTELNVETVNIQTTGSFTCTSGTVDATNGGRFRAAGSVDVNNTTASCP